MNVQVQITNSIKAAANSTILDIKVNPADTVLNVQDLIASISKTNSFPDHKLLFKGETLSSSQRLSECDINDGDVLEFVFNASEQVLVKQLSELLGKQAVPPEELSLLYSYRYSVSFEDALKAMGYTDCKLRQFLEDQKCFCFKGNLVHTVQPTEKAPQSTTGLTSIKEDKVHRWIEVSICVEVHVDGKAPKTLSDDEDEDAFMRLEASDTVAKSKESIAALQQMPFPQRELFLGDQKLSDELSLDEAGVKNGSALLMVVHASQEALVMQLEQLLRERTGLSTTDLSLNYCQRFGTPIGQALRTLGLHSNLGRFLQGQPRFLISGGCVTLAHGPQLITPATEQDVEYASETVDYVIDLLSEASFLDVGRVEKACCIAGEAKATVYVNGLPRSRQPVQGLQIAMASALEAMRFSEPSIDSAEVQGDLLKVQVEGSQTVSIRLEAA